MAAVPSGQDQAAVRGAMFPSASASSSSSSLPVIGSATEEEQRAARSLQAFQSRASIGQYPNPTSAPSSSSLATGPPVSGVSTNPTRTTKAKSCRECIRLKHKCSRAPWPCDKCKERGIGALCPDSQLSTRSYKRGREKKETSTALSSSSSSSAAAAAAAARRASSSSETTQSGMDFLAYGQPNGERLGTEQPSNGHLAGSPQMHKRARTSYAATPDATRSLSEVSSSQSQTFDRLSRTAFWPDAQSSAAPTHTSTSPVAASHSLQPQTFDAALASSSSASITGRLADGRDQRDHVTTSSSSSSVATGDDVIAEKGTLICEKSGKSSYYGPGSHSFLLAQPAGGDDALYSRAASPQSLYSEGGDSHGNMSPEDEVSRPSSDPLARPHLRRPSSSSRRTVTFLDTSPAGTSSSGPYSVDAIRKTILDNPAAFLAIPGVMPPFQIDQLVQQLCAHLPPVAQARRAFRSYQQNCSWMYDPITALDRLWEEFYGAKALQIARRADVTPRFHPHRVSLLFCVLCLGVLFDVKRNIPRVAQGEKGDRRAERYYHWAWVALQLSNSTDSHTLEGVQAIMLIGIFLCNRKNGRNADSFFPLMGTAMRSAISMGLHREGGAWKMPSEELEERRRLFWDLYSSDCFRSLAYGRPCSVQDAHVDAIFPTQRIPRGLSDVFHAVKYQVVRLMNRILDACQRSTIPYSTVLGFDRALRGLWAELPAPLNPLPRGRRTDVTVNLDDISVLDDEDREIGMTPEGDDLHLFLQGHTIVANINQALLHLHRPWFVRALQQDQQQTRADRHGNKDAFESRFARSVVAVSESSRALIQTAQAILDITPTLGMAWNFWWTHAFNAGVCQYLQVVHNPSSITTFGAWDDARRALMILQQARPDKQDVIWAGKIHLLKRLHERAESQLKATHDARKGHDRFGLERSGRDTPIEIPYHEEEEHLRLVGATSSIDRRGANTVASGTIVEGQSQATETSTPQDDTSVASTIQRSEFASDAGMGPPPPHSLQQRAPVHGEQYSPRQPSVVGQQSVSSETSDWIPSLSHSLIGSLFESSAHSFPDNIDNVRQSDYYPQQAEAAHRTPGSVPNQATGDSAQFDWLLTELLQGGAEPEANFWESMFGGGQFGGPS